MRTLTYTEARNEYHCIVFGFVLGLVVGLLF